MNSREAMNAMARTITTLRGLEAAAKAFRADPNDSRADDRLRAWLVEAESVSKLWASKQEEKP